MHELPAPEKKSRSPELGPVASQFRIQDFREKAEREKKKKKKYPSFLAIGRNTQ